MICLQLNFVIMLKLAMHDDHNYIHIHLIKYMCTCVNKTTNLFSVYGAYGRVSSHMTVHVQCLASLFQTELLFRRL